jgi:putative CocE/NonD family hydrolase
MSLISRYIAWKNKLPPAETYAVVHERDLPIPMPEGAVLLADRYYPTQGDKLPTILIRSPYGRRNWIFDAFARIFAERGFQVLVQSCRGTYGSGGKFFPFRDDRTDGLATIAWLKEQPWYSGEFAMFGPSYLSYVQWAVGDEAGPDLKALIPIVTTAEFRTVTYPSETFGLDTILSWAQGMVFQEDPPLKALLSRFQHARRLAKALMHLPLNQADRMAAGVTVDFFQDWLAHNPPGDSWWKAMDHRAAVSQVKAPVHLIGGFYDVLFPHTLECYRLLHEAGRNPYLTIGPWTHGAPAMQPVMIIESLKWLRAHLQNDRSGLRQAPVKLYVMGSNLWKEFAAWPPEGYPPQRWYLQAGGGLAKTLPSGAEPDRYRYDPADPTPSVGGSSLTPNSGPKDNRQLEARKDVLVYTSLPLEQVLEVIGPLRAELYIKSSLQHTDFFARLCDVFPSGESINLSDGIVRLVPERFAAAADSVQKVEIELWPTANCFQKGHRIRLQVSSGAHPRFARNPGSGDPLATASRLIPADQEVFHDPGHPSAILLPAQG